MMWGNPGRLQVDGEACRCRLVMRGPGGEVRGSRGPNGTLEESGFESQPVVVASTQSPCSPIKQPTPSFLRKVSLVLSPHPSPGNFLFRSLRPWRTGFQLPSVAPHGPQMEKFP